jgi:hypothetical protein
MTDPQTAIPGRRLPPPTFFDPTFERLPSAAAYDPDHPGPVLLLFDPRADRRWVADAAIALATGWNAAGRRTVLADLSIEDPILHERVGVPNLDGVVDLFLYGASLARSARPVPGRGFLLITAGTYTPEPEAIFRHPRWEKIVEGFREAQASLLLFVPLDAPALSSLARWAGEVILLGDREDGELLESLVAPLFAVRAWLTPPAKPGAEPFRVGEDPVRPAAYGAGPQPHTPPPAPGERFPQPEPGGFQPWAAPPREPAPRGPDPLPGAGEAASAPAASLPVPDPAWEDTVAEAETGKRRKKKSIPKERRVSPLLLVLLVILFIVAAVAVASYFVPGLLGARTPSQAQPAAAAARVTPRRAPALSTAAPAGVPRRYSVVVKAFQGDQAFETARKWAERVQQEIPGTEAYVFPEDNGGLVYYRVFAGMVADTAQAAALRQELVRQKLVDPESVGGSGDLIQERPLAFSLGDFATRAEAEAKAQSLRAGAVDAYPVPVPQTDGSERWTLYAGAFEDSIQAQPMKKTLDAARIPAHLVPRVGRAPATSK